MVVANGTVTGCGPYREVITIDMLREIDGIVARIELCSHGDSHVIVDGVADRRAT